MTAALVFAGLAALIAIVAWRPHGWGPAAGALAAVALAALSGTIGLADVGAALRAQWRAFVTLAAVMTMTSAAERHGLFERLAAWIEPHTRGPVRRAFRVTFALAAVVAAVLSNDAAVLVMTPTVIALLRTVYPRRHPKFLVPFALAVFAAAGVAPLVISNPMNLIFADATGIGFNRYAAVMIPIALAGWLVAYRVLVWIFREPLADVAPALGAWPARPPPMTAGGWIVIATVVGLLAAYPILALVDVPAWPIAAAGGVVCAAVSLAARHDPRRLAAGVAWGVFPFLVGVFVLALALERVGVVGWLRELYGATGSSTAVVGTVSALGSALLNNHPMSVLNAFALDGASSDAPAFAALIGGDLGPRLLPVGSLASLLWYDLLRKHGVTVRVATFVRVGALLTVPTLAVSLALLALLARL